MSKMINGFILVDAPYSALNNAGTDAGDSTDNIVRVKYIQKGRDRYPYVSGQALRYWWRETLEEKFDWNLSPISRETKIAFTAANPIDYEDDDVFGYMRALKKKDGGTVTRISPLKNSPLVSIISQNPTNDFGVMARHEGDPVPYEHEFYSTVLKGIFSLDLNSIGVFSSVEKTGYKNMYPELEKIAEEKDLEKDENGNFILNKEVRLKRTTDVIQVLPYLQGGAKLTSHLTDVVPKFIVLCVVNGGNHIFMNIAEEKEGKPYINFGAIDEYIEEYNDIILTKVYIGVMEGFMNDLKSEIKDYYKNNDKIVIGTIKETVNNFSAELDGLM
ncbi:MAG: type I-B CRISPR-associated protein Cas7/Cst2/DevR [Methanobrevibacter sp.]|nr:type I-B CRISPR-associated protein Cas7/Cst2/DevR [Methanobrevibacter sp.]